MRTQAQQILDQLTIQTLTSGQIERQFGVRNGPDEIYKLRHQGHNIETETITVRKRNGRKARVARYRLRT